MVTNITYGKKLSDSDLGCDFYEVLCATFSGKIEVCHVKVSDIQKIALAFTKIVQDQSWIQKLDQGTQRSYNKTAADTAKALVDIFNSVSSNNPSNKIAGDFGELVVSIGSSKALEKIFEHHVIPIAELWKPQVKQNEGFDFHTVCKNERINFGEAKYSSSGNTYSNALLQAKRFVEEEKHLRDRVHLINLAPKNSITNLDQDKFGIVASFSLCAADPLPVLSNAINKALQTFPDGSVDVVYIVGVSS